MTDVSPSDNWYRIATWFASMPTDEAINRTLALLGPQAGADRAWVIRYSEDALLFWNTHEWVNTEVEPFVTDMQGIATQAVYWLQKQLDAGRIVQVPAVEKLPQRAGLFRVELQRQKVKSIVCIPIFIDEKLTLQVGFDAVYQHRQWPDASVAMMQQAGTLFAKALAQNQTHTIKPVDSPVNTVPLRRGLGIVNIEADQILYLKAERDYSRVFFVHDRSVIQHTTMKRWEAVLPESRFLRIHKSLIVNVTHLQTLDRTAGRWSVKLNRLDETLPVGRAYRDKLRERLWR